MAVLAALYALATAALLVYGLNLLWLSVLYVRQDHPGSNSSAALPILSEPDASWPAVTVQLPLYNEAYVAERLIDACAGLDYPPELLEIQVLDDSTDETVDRVAYRIAFWKARGIDMVHIRRKDRTGYKAGALQNGLALAHGAFIAIFDADFMPHPDFLRRTIPLFLKDDALGLVQGRWGHLNASSSLLTLLQAFGLDTHFAIEQQVRSRAGYFVNFNGTGGVLRKQCIQNAGGWQADTLTEDLDLSYRAQLQGWRFLYLHDLEVPAELPSDMNALRSQQFRWAKGTIETARKLLSPLWRSELPLRIKIEGTIHLTSHLVFPALLLAALLHTPLLLLEHQGRGPGPSYFAFMGIGILGLIGFFLAQALAQRDLYADWIVRLRWFLLFMAGSTGIALSNTQAILAALVGRQSAFERTPKYATSRAKPKVQYISTHLPTVVFFEIAFMVYCLLGAGILAATGLWIALPFQLLFALGSGMVILASLQQRRKAKAASHSLAWPTRK